MYKNILLIIRSNSKLNLLQIFDINNNKLDETIINNKYIFKGKLNTPYRIKIISNKTLLQTSICITNNYNDPYIFNLENNNLSHKIFIKLIDKNYNNLLIEKGEIKLWKKNMKL